MKRAPPTASVIEIILVTALLAFGIAACGTFNLGNVHPQASKTAEQQQLDTLTCKDQANLAANTAGRQTGDFLLGMTIVGAPVAYEREKAKEREMFADCMKARGYVVTPADDHAPTTTKVAATSPAPATNPAVTTPVPGADQLSLALPAGFSMRTVPDTMKTQGVIFYAENRTLDMGLVVLPVTHEGITDLTAYALPKKAGQSDRLKDATSSEITRFEVGGRKAARYTVTGTSTTNVKVTYVTTLIEGHSEIVIVSAWTGASNAVQQMTLLESLAGGVSGIS